MPVFDLPGSRLAARRAPCAVIVGDHSVIRTAERDDATMFARLFRLGCPLASLMDQKREYLIPTIDELRELLGGTKNMGGIFNAVEDLSGSVRGFCTVRSAPGDMPFGQFALMMLDEEDYALPIMDDVMRYLAAEAFQRRGQNKVMVYRLDYEAKIRELYLANGFRSDGIQREVLYAGGRWHDLESLTLVNPGGHAPRERLDA